MRRVLIAVLIASVSASAAASETFDIVLKGGRAVDPETGLDGIRDVGVIGDRIAAVSPEPLAGRRVIDVRGLVVVPGFIDLHQHQQEAQTYRLKVLDGVTTALELETGVPDIGRFLDVRRGKNLINYGATASHEAARVAAWGLPMPPSTTGPEAGIPDPPEGPVTNEAASPARLQQLLSFLRRELDAGALGVGVGLEYTAGATRQEVLEVFRLAAEYHRPVYVHIRAAGRIEPGSSIESVGEVIGAAAVTGAPLHIVHINSMCMSQAPECLEMIAGARARGLDVTTEAYPYGAFMTFVNSGAFAEGWRERYGMDYGDVAVPDTGERLTRERFELLHFARRQVRGLVGNGPYRAVVDLERFDLGTRHVRVGADGANRALLVALDVIGRDRERELARLGADVDHVLGCIGADEDAILFRAVLHRDADELAVLEVLDVGGFLVGNLFGSRFRFVVDG